MTGDPFVPATRVHHLEGRARADAAGVRSARRGAAAPPVATARSKSRSMRAKRRQRQAASPAIPRRSSHSTKPSAWHRRSLSTAIGIEQKLNAATGNPGAARGGAIGASMLLTLTLITVRPGRARTRRIPLAVAWALRDASRSVAAIADGLEAVQDHTVPVDEKLTTINGALSALAAACRRWTVTSRPRRGCSLS